MSKEEILYNRIRRLQVAIKGVQQELDEIIESQAPKAPVKKARKKSEKELEFEMYRKMYAKQLNR
jgi:ATP-dependent protease Clp ATPase subunit